MIHANLPLLIHDMELLDLRLHVAHFSVKTVAMDHACINSSYACYRWQKVKLTVTIVAVLLIIVYAIIAFTCSPTFHC